MRENEALFYSALRNKYNKAAILKEVTIPDEKEEVIYRASQVISRPYMKRYYDKDGLSYDAEVPEDYNPREAKFTRRIDFVIFDGKQITAVEMKVSRADFKRDTEQKRRAWKAVSNRFVYLTPAGLLKPEEIPEGCGLWEYTNGKIVVVKKAKVNNTPEAFPDSMIRYFAWRAFIAESTKHTVRRR